MSAENREWPPLDLIKVSAKFLAQKKISSPRLDAEVLLAAVLQCSRLELYAEKSALILTAAQLNTYRQFIRRRSEHEPVARILGKKEFMNLEFIVTPEVLSPRPETEILVEQILHLLNPTPKTKKSELVFQSLASKAREFIVANSPVEHGNVLPAEMLVHFPATEVIPNESISNSTVENNSPFAEPRILELGCGSGCIAITLAKKFPSAQITTLDISESALVVAKQNAEKHGVASRLNFLASDWFNALPAGATFDFIIANPPYIPQDENLDPEVRDYDPPLALFGGKDGLAAYREIIKNCEPFFSRHSHGNYLLLEIGAGQINAVRDLIRAQFSDAIMETLPDYAGIDRVITARLTCIK